MRSKRILIIRTVQKTSKSQKKIHKGHLWSRGNFKDSIGRNTQQAVEEYVRNQEHIKSIYTRGG